MRRWARTIRLTVSEEAAAEAIAAHRALLRRMSKEGVLRQAWILTAGRSGADPGAGAVDGFLEILETADRLEAEEWCRRSPLLEAGFAAWSLVPVRDWRPED